MFATPTPPFMPSRRQSACGLAIALTLTLPHLIGCTKPGAQVSGEVTLDGQPLAEGLITFRPLPNTRGPEFSAKITDGKFTVTKTVLPGEYNVDIRSHQKTGHRTRTPLGETDEILQVVSPQYQGPTTTLRANLREGNNPLTFAATRN